MTVPSGRLTWRSMMARRMRQRRPTPNAGLTQSLWWTKQTHDARHNDSSLRLDLPSTGQPYLGKLHRGLSRAKPRELSGELRFQVSWLDSAANPNFGSGFDWQPKWLRAPWPQ
jgi:hypothetical protein